MSNHNDADKEYKFEAQRVTFYYNKWNWSDTIHISTYEADSNDTNQITLGTLEIDVPEQIFSHSDVVDKTITTLLTQRNKVEKAYEQDIKNIDEQIENLRALPAPVYSDDPVFDDIPF